MRRWWRGLKRGEQLTLLGSVVALVVGIFAAIPSYNVFFLSDSPSPAPLAAASQTVSPSSSVNAGPLVTANIAFMDESPRFALSTSLDEEAQKLFTGGSGGLEVLPTRLRESGASYVYGIVLQMSLQTKSEKPVRITNVRPKDMRSSPPVGGTFVEYPSGSDSPTYQVKFDMNDPIPTARELTEASGPGDPFFKKKTLSITNRDDVVLVMSFSTSLWSGSFEIGVDYVADGKAGQISVTDQGRPFRLSALNCRPGGKYAEYREVWAALGQDEGADPNLYQLGRKRHPESVFSC
jgi:hypothetical protein